MRSYEFLEVNKSSHVLQFVVAERHERGEVLIEDGTSHNVKIVRILTLVDQASACTCIRLNIVCHGTCFSILSISRCNRFAGNDTDADLAQQLIVRIVLEISPLRSQSLFVLVVYHRP